MSDLLNSSQRLASDTSSRLSSTLFVMALAHGIVILGITFTGGLAPPTDETPSLKVTLLTNVDRAQPRPEDSEYLANTDQLGGGRDDAGPRPTNALFSPDPLTVDGDELGADLTDSVTAESTLAAEQIVTRRSSDRSVAAEPNAPDPATDIPRRAAAMMNLPNRQTLVVELGELAQLPDDADRDDVTSPKTRAALVAEYLDAWRRRVERIGTLNFPEQFFTGDATTRRPTLEVAIGADGDLKAIVVKRTSGDRAIDQAALTILRMAAPFEPLPQELLTQYDNLRFAYEWDFIRGTHRPEPQ
jgi:protein TonB